MLHTLQSGTISRLISGLVLLAVTVLNPLLAADKINDSAALKDLSIAKSVFLIDFSDAAKTDFYLKTIKGTHQSLARQNVESEMVLVFIGKTVEFLTTAPKDHVTLDFEEELESIAQTTVELKQLGVRMEVCAVATRVFDIDNDTILPQMNVVGDGFISLIGWQNQGYKLVPIF